MRYNDKSVVTAQNVCGKLGYKTVHSVYRLANVLGIEHWKLTGKELARFKVDNGLVSAVRWLTVYPVDAFDGLHRSMLVKCPELKQEEPVKNTRMSQELTALSFENKEFGELRGVNVLGEPWFVGHDVAAALGYENISRDIDRHVDDDDMMMLKRRNGKALLQRYRNGTFSDEPQPSQDGNFEISMETLGFTVPPRGLTVINESGMYSLILSSKLPSAKKFKHWVTSEVLPSIRKTGGYGVEGSLATVLENQRVLMRSMEALWLYLSTRDACAMSFSKEIAKHEMR